VDSQILPLSVESKTDRAEEFVAKEVKEDPVSFSLVVTAIEAVIVWENIVAVDSSVSIPAEPSETTTVERGLSNDFVELVMIPERIEVK
jgi:hypothetical protein